MDLIPKSCAPNKEKYYVKNFIEENSLELEIISISECTEKYPEQSTLVELITDLYDLSSIRTNKDLENIYSYLISLINDKSAENDEKKKLRKLKQQLDCVNCQNRPKDIENYPHKLCKNCFSELLEKGFCLNCLVKYERTSRKSTCGHLCIFCVGILLRNQINNCPTCQNNFETEAGKINAFKSVCNNCGNMKTFSEDKLLRLTCGHLHCYECLREDIKQGKCCQSSCGIDARQYFLFNFLYAKCVNCKARKSRNSTIISRCCFKEICTDCQAKSKNCLGCDKLIMNIDDDDDPMYS